MNNDTITTGINSNGINSNEANITGIDTTNSSSLIGDTGWTWEAAASMAKECAREDRLFGRRNRRPARRNRTVSKQTLARRAAKFLADTGWTMEDAAAMAKDCMRDSRLFGSPRMYATV